MFKTLFFAAALAASVAANNSSTDSESIYQSKKGKRKPSVPRPRHADGEVTTVENFNDLEFKLHSSFVSKTLFLNEEMIIASNGPYTVKLQCTPSFSSILSVYVDVVNNGSFAFDLFFDATSESNVANIKPGNELSFLAWRIGTSSATTAGNDIDDGAFMTSTGYYFGWDGETTIGFVHNSAIKDFSGGVYNKNDFGTYTNVTCGFAGIIWTAHPDDTEYNHLFSSDLSLSSTASFSDAGSGIIGQMMVSTFTWMLCAGVAFVAMKKAGYQVTAAPATSTDDKVDDRSSSSLLKL